MTPPHDWTNDTGKEIGEILADFEQDHGEEKAVRSIMRLKQEAYEAGKGEMVHNSAGFIETAMVPAKAIQAARLALIEELREDVNKKMPTLCGKCGKPGVNPYGECLCSYNLSPYIKKADVLSLLTSKVKEQTKQ